MTYLGNSRRNFLKTLTTTALISTSSLSGLANIVGRKNEDGFYEKPFRGIGFHREMTNDAWGQTQTS